MKICIRDVDRYIEALPWKSALIVLAGRLDTYPEALAIDIARRCLLAEPRLGLIIVTVNDDPQALEDLAGDLALDLKAETEAGRAKLLSVSSLESALKAVDDVPDDSIVILDATSWFGDITRHLPGLRDLALRVRHEREDTIVLLVLNPSILSGGWSAVEGVAEIADIYIRLESVVGTQGVERYMDVAYFKRGVIPYLRLHYILRRGGIEYSLRVEV